MRTKYNDPFYFALPRHASNESVARAVRHIDRTFGISGTVLFVRTDDEMDLYKMFHGDKASS